ncbi:MAG: HAMP domain-containing protein [Deltaproteobacteria bacterium]|nr:HAMP domain-containing protein [Deltaproteobacteria bacterium]
MNHLPPIRFQISVLLLLATLNTLVFGTVAFALFAALAASPSQSRTQAVRAFEATFSSVQVRVLDATVVGQPLPANIDESLAAAEAALDSLGDDARGVREELDGYRGQLAAWNEHLRSPAHSAVVGIEDTAGMAQSREIARAAQHVVGAARQLVYYTRPYWVDALEPYLPFMGAWVVLCSIVTVVLAGGLRVVMSQPLERLTSAADALSRGQLDVPIPAPEGAPEIQTLARAVSAARSRLVETIDVLDVRNRQTATMLARLGDGVILADAHGAVVESNAQADAMLVSINRDYPRVRDLSELLPELLLAYFAADEDRSVEFERTLAARKRWFEVDLRRVPRAGARQVGVWVVVMHDVTSAREVENIKRDFLSVITHELKTPLVTIEGFAKLLLMNKGGELTEKQRTWVQNIRDQGQVLLTMVTNLLDATRLEGGNLPINPQPVVVSDLLAQWANTWRPAVETRGLRLATRDDAPPAARVSIDTFRMQQVVGNLVNNALKFTGPGGEIELGARVEGPRVVLSIADTGRGIPADAVPHLFEKFYQVETGDTRVAGGAGLGLYIVHELVAAQAGRIVVHSQVGRGSRFDLSFPLCENGVPAP